MSFNDYRMSTGRMEERLEEAQRLHTEAELRQQFGKASQPWLMWKACQALCRLGNLMVAAGERLQRYGVPSQARLERNPG